MASGNGLIQRAPLLPPNSPTITEADRGRVYAIIGKELNNILNGPGSYYPDSLKKSSRDLTSELDGFVDAVSCLRDVVNDPANILGEIGSDLDKFKKTFKLGVSNDVETMWNDPRDLRDQGIKLPDSIAPTTEDHNAIYVDPEPDLWYPVPNPVSPKPSVDLRASMGTPQAQAAVVSPANSAWHDSRVGSFSSGPGIAGLPRWFSDALAPQPEYGVSRDVSFAQGDRAVREDPQNIRILSRRPAT